MQVYKATGDIDSAQKMFDTYTGFDVEGVNSTTASKPWLKWRDIVVARKRPRKFFIQANTVEKGKQVLFLT